MARDLGPFTDDLAARLRSILASRPWIVGSEVTQGACWIAGDLLRAGAAQVMAAGVLSGVGDVDDDIPMVDFDLMFDGSVMESMRFANRMLHDPPPHVLAAVDEWDPEAAARSVVDFTMSGGTVCGRPAYGARTPEWAALEDKLVAGDIWRGARIDAGSFDAVDLSDAEQCRRSHDGLATTVGSVFAGDNEPGFHGGADSTLWVPDASHVDRVVDELAVEHRRARVMPFVEGLPCSVHGMVLDDVTLAFRPMEMLIYRDVESFRFVYGKAASFWDPAPKDREAMRAMARSVGDELRRRADFRGIFTLDGVMGVDGFVPTEVNPRMGGALPSLIETPSGNHINLFLVNLAVVAGDLGGLDAATLESWVLGDLDRRRRGIGMLETTNAPEDEKAMSVGITADGELVVLGDRDADEKEAPTELASVVYGEKSGHGLVRIVLGSGFDVGASVAPVVLDIARLADEMWDMGLGPLEPAADVRSAR